MLAAPLNKFAHRLSFHPSFSISPRRKMRSVAFTSPLDSSEGVNGKYPADYVMRQAGEHVEISKPSMKIVHSHLCILMDYRVIEVIGAETAS